MLIESNTKMKKFLNRIFFILIILISSCNNITEDYKNLTSNKSDIEFYKLKEVINNDDFNEISVSIPNNLNKVSPPDNKTIFQYTFFDDKSGYMVSMDKLVSKTTQKLNNKEYVDVSNKWFLNDLNGDLSEIERMLSPRMEDVRVVSLDGNVIINDKYFIKRVS